MSPRPQLPPEAVEARRNSILEAAIDQIAQRGPEALRMKDVAAAAQVSVGTVQYYFDSREDLLVKAFSAHSQGVIAAIGALSTKQGDPWAQLLATCEAVPTVKDYQRRASVWVELVAASRRNDYLKQTVTEVFAQWRAHFESIIVAGIADGSFTPRIEIPIVIDTLIAQIDGFDLATASARTGPTPESIITSLTATAAALLGVELDVSVSV